MLRIMMDNVWFPAFPPIPVTIVMVADNATTWAIMLSKLRMAKDDRKAVSRFTHSHGSLRRTDCGMLLSMVSSLLTPASFSISSVCSSMITSMISSTVMIPRRTFLRLTTGIAFRSYLDTRRATSS